MAKKRHTAEQIFHKWREAELALTRGEPLTKLVRKLGNGEQTHCRWQKEYSGLRMDQALRLCLARFGRTSLPRVRYAV